MHRLGLRQIFSEVVREAWTSFEATLITLPPAGFSSSNEERQAKKIIDGFQSKNPSGSSTFTTNEYIFGFECDLVHRTVVDGKTRIIDYEIDGICHLQTTKSRFCHLRDEYLQRRGVKIIRKIVL